MKNVSTLAVVYVVVFASFLEQVLKDQEEPRVAPLKEWRGGFR